MCSLIEEVMVDSTKCKGCTHCIKHCPVQAIRVKRGKARMINNKCIHCGTCIQVCSFNAFTGVHRDLEDIFQYPYRIAIIDPVLYSQFHEEITASDIVNAIKKQGFHDVWDLSQGANLVTKYTQKHMTEKPKLPIISSSCPAIIRLIQLRFHELTPHILPIKTPAEITAYMARKKAEEVLKIPNEEIGVYYFSPCTGKMLLFNQPRGMEAPYINGVISIKAASLMLSKDLKPGETANPPYSTTKEVDWGRVEGQSKALGIKEYLAIDGIENVMEILEKVQDDKMKDLTFLECQACTNGCVGGNLTMENPFIARNRIRGLAENKHTSTCSDMNLLKENPFFIERFHPLHHNKLDSDLFKAIEKLRKIEEINNRLPQKDCGACGAPSCRALAKDIVLNYAKEEDCMISIKKITLNSIVEKARIRDYI